MYIRRRFERGVAASAAMTCDGLRTDRATRVMNVLNDAERRDQHRVGKLRQALQTFQKIEHIDPSFEPAYCNRILTYTELGEHEKAEEMFYLARLYKDHCPRCYYYMGVSLNARGQYEKAIYCWRKTLDLDDAHPEAHVRIAEALWAKGELEQSRRHYLAGLRQDPG